MKSLKGKKLIDVIELKNGYAILVFSDGQRLMVKSIDFIPNTEAPEEATADEEEAEDEEEEEEEEAEDEEEEEAHTEDEIMGLNKKELKALIKDEELDVTPKDYPKVGDLREAVIEALGLGEEEEEEEEEGDDDEEVSYSWEDLKGMDADELEDLCDENNLDTDPEDYEDDEDNFRKAIAGELDIEIPKAKKGKKSKKK